MYWLLNTVLGLFIISEYSAYLEDSYPELKKMVLVFSLKWFSSVFLAILIVFLITLGSAIRCFTGDTDEIWAAAVGMFLPVYCLCLIMQQYYACGFGIYFFEQVKLGRDGMIMVEEGGEDYTLMDQDCLDLTQFFFLNEIVVGVLTLIQCCGMILCR